ncbi:MAG: hypothetical protein HDR15_09300 [Lachnospiraceae bacterium]|nr:hypothetical protein [Lachnospiraceae bacterium]
MRKEIHFTSGIKLFCVLAAGLFLLPACGKTEQKSVEENVLESGSCVSDSDFEYYDVAESDKGYYFWEQVSTVVDYPLLMFRDKESGRVVPLCNKPDCMHDVHECNAYFPSIDFVEDGIDKFYLQYYGGSLYAVGLSSDRYVTLFRIMADGSEWEIDTKLYKTDYSTGQWRTPDILIIDGYVYFIDGKQKMMKLERMPLGGGTAEVVFEGDSNAEEVQVYRMKSQDGALFFQALEFVDGNFDHATGGLYRYDFDAGQCSLVKKGLSCPYSVQNGLVYYGGGEGLCCYSIQDEAMEILTDQSMDVPNITLTNKYIILFDQMGGGTLYIYDHEGEELAEVSGDLKPSWYFGGNSDLLFGECRGDESFRLCFLDLNRPFEELQWEGLK